MPRSLRALSDRGYTTFRQSRRLPCSGQKQNKSNYVTLQRYAYFLERTNYCPRPAATSRAWCLESVSCQRGWHQMVLRLKRYSQGQICSSGNGVRRRVPASGCNPLSLLLKLFSCMLKKNRIFAERFVCAVFCQQIAIQDVICKIVEPVQAEAHKKRVAELFSPPKQNGL